MSRCFPFPPPGYILNGTRDEALIEPIKGAEKKAKKEQSRKERKRDKKDKKDKKEKKEKKRKERGEGETEKHSHKRRRKEEGAKDGQNQKADVFRKLKQTENDCLEKSSLTVEPELLQSTSQNSCDSTLNSNEKEKQTLDGRHNNNDSESIIRIRLPIRRQKDPEVTMMTNKDHPCSTSAPEHASKPHEEKKKDLGKEKRSSSSTKTSRPSRLCRICPPSTAMQFLNVVENWVPNTIGMTNSEDEECWWLKKPSNHKFGTESCEQLNLNDETKQVTSSSVSWPCARLLHEADVYALPYTVPF